MIKRLYRNRLSLLTDLYQLTMAYGYHKSGLYRREAVFNLYYRKNPFQGDFAIACGLETVIEYLQNFHFDWDDIQYLAQLKGQDDRPLFDESFLNYLQRWEFQCDVDAIPEGTLVFPNEPLIRIKGPLLQAQLLETALLNLINFPTLIATKSARICQAAAPDPVLEFGLRRAQGIDGGVSASRAAYIGGCVGTSNVLAGRLCGIPVKGTHAHSWIMCHPDEIGAFRTYAQAMPNNCVFLVDTYDTLQGVKNAITIGHELREQGFDLQGIRLDSGDLVSLSRQARQLLDEAGFPAASIVASNDLDEYRIKSMKEQGCMIDSWGVGTRLSTAYDQSALGGVYKLAALQDETGTWQYKIKLSEQAVKTSNPGIQQVFRKMVDGVPVGDVVYDASLDPDFATALEGVPLLESIFRRGKLVYAPPKLVEVQAKTKAQLSLFQKNNISSYPVELAEKLQTIKNELIQTFS